MNIEAKLKELGLELPTAGPPPAGNFVRAMRTGNLLYLAGHGPMRDGVLAYKGKVGRDVTKEEAYEAAKLVALNCLSTVKSALGDLDQVKRVIKVLGFVNCTDEFTDQPKVMNGCSDLLVALFGEAGRHARSAIGTNSLPSGMPVEIEMILEVE